MIQPPHPDLPIARLAIVSGVSAWMMSISVVSQTVEQAPIAPPDGIVPAEANPLPPSVQVASAELNPEISATSIPPVPVVDPIPPGMEAEGPPVAFPVTEPTPLPFSGEMPEAVPAENEVKAEPAFPTAKPFTTGIPNTGFGDVGGFTSMSGFSGRPFGFGQVPNSFPIGGGLGSTGVWGQRFTPGSFLAMFAPDSGLIRVAVELGWVGEAACSLLLLPGSCPACDRRRRTRSKRRGPERRQPVLPCR